MSATYGALRENSLKFGSCLVPRSSMTSSAAALAALPNLKVVKALGIALSEDGVAHLTQLRDLELICVRAIDDALLDRLKAALPNCTIRVSQTAGF